MANFYRPELTGSNPSTAVLLSATCNPPEPCPQKGLIHVHVPSEGEQHHPSKTSDVTILYVSLCSIVHRVGLVLCKPPLRFWQSWYFLISNERRLFWFGLRRETMRRWISTGSYIEQTFTHNRSSAPETMTHFQSSFLLDRSLHYRVFLLRGHYSIETYHGVPY